MLAGRYEHCLAGLLFLVSLSGLRSSGLLPERMLLTRDTKVLDPKNIGLRLSFHLCETASAVCGHAWHRLRFLDPMEGSQKDALPECGLLGYREKGFRHLHFSFSVPVCVLIISSLSVLLLFPCFSLPSILPSSINS